MHRSSVNDLVTAVQQAGPFLIPWPGYFWTCHIDSSCMSCRPCSVKPMRGEEGFDAAESALSCAHCRLTWTTSTAV